MGRAKRARRALNQSAACAAIATLALACSDGGGADEASNFSGELNNVDPSTINWGSLNRNNFPYTLVQRPGPYNAMGQVKFMFPNRHAIYLHDTPSRELLSRNQRAFSAGCIRVKDPLELARVLLDDPDNWSAQRIQALDGVSCR